MDLGESNLVKGWQDATQSLVSPTTPVTAMQVQEAHPRLGPTQVMTTPDHVGRSDGGQHPIDKDRAPQA